MVDLYKRATKCFELSHTPVVQTDDEKKALQDALEAVELSVGTRRKAGRYTLEEAACFVATHGAARAQSILNGLMDAIARDTLNIYEPGLNSRFKTNVVRPWRDEAYWSDLNDWLGEHEPHIQCVFPDPVSIRATAKAEEISSTNPGDSDWMVQARLIADDLHAKDKRSEAFDSKRHMAERVADEMRKRGIYGPRGPLMGSTILREALQGGRWKRESG